MKSKFNEPVLRQRFRISLPDDDSESPKSAGIKRSSSKSDDKDVNETERDDKAPSEEESSSNGQLERPAKKLRR